MSFDSVKDILFFFLRTFLLRKLASDIKKKGLLFYLKILQTARKSLIGAIFIFSILQLMIFGLVGALIAGIFLLPQDLEMKIWILFFTGLGFFLVPLFLLIYILSEKVWLKASHAEELINQP